MIHNCETQVLVLGAIEASHKESTFHLYYLMKTRQKISTRGSDSTIDRNNKTTHSTWCIHRTWLVLHRLRVSRSRWRTMTLHIPAVDPLAQRRLLPGCFEDERAPILWVFESRLEWFRQTNCDSASDKPGRLVDQSQRVFPPMNWLERQWAISNRKIETMSYLQDSTSCTYDDGLPSCHYPISQDQKDSLAWQFPCSVYPTSHCFSGLSWLLFYSHKRLRANRSGYHIVTSNYHSWSTLDLWLLFDEINMENVSPREVFEHLTNISWPIPV